MVVAETRRKTLQNILARMVMVGVLVIAGPVRACIWDADTLAQEQRHSPKLAEVILATTLPRVDTAKLRERITRLEADRREGDPAWWNDLAGAHLRLGEPQQAVALLEPAVKRFPRDYGIHANLGTAYHLLGRYQEAEREIGKDLEINPDAHFGLERYHLALLQYLVRDRDYQSRHVYVDEWSFVVLNSLHPTLLPEPAGKISGDDPWRGVSRRAWYSEEARTPAMLVQRARSELKKARASKGKSSPIDIPSLEANLSQQTWIARMLADPPPPYRYRWDLARDPRFEEGVIYLASLNPDQPACTTMLGIAAMKRRDLNLAAHAFQRSIDLGSPQSGLLWETAGLIREHIRDSQAHQAPRRARSYVDPLLTVAAALFLALLGYIRLQVRRRRNHSGGGGQD